MFNIATVCLVSAVAMSQACIDKLKLMIIIAIFISLPQRHTISISTSPAPSLLLDNGPGLAVLLYVCVMFILWVHEFPRILNRTDSPVYELSSRSPCLHMSFIRIMRVPSTCSHNILQGDYWRVLRAYYTTLSCCLYVYSSKEVKGQKYVCI